MKMRIEIAVGSLLACFSGLVYSAVESSEYVIVRFKDVGQANIDRRTVPPTVNLPAKIKAELDAKFPGFSVPNTSNYKFDWLDSYSEEPVPFIAIGDFDHSGSDDIALLVKNRTGDNNWKLVVFNRDGQKYVAHVLVTSPSEEGRDFGPIQRYIINSSTACQNASPCLHLFVYESAGFEYEWRADHYFEVNIGD